MNYHGPYSSREAEAYDRDREAELLWHVENQYLAELIRRTSAKSVLDVPIGTGRFLDLYRHRHIVGIDLSDAMLKEASNKAARCLENEVVLIKGSVTSIPFPDKSCDLVVCWRLLHLLPPDMLEAAFSELRRVCNGVLCVQVYVQAPPLERLRAKAWRWARRLLLLFRRRKKLTAWSHITAFDHPRAVLDSAAVRGGLGSPDRIDDLGSYEGTRVVAMTWNLHP